MVFLVQLVKFSSRLQFLLLVDTKTRMSHTIYFTSMRSKYPTTVSDFVSIYKPTLQQRPSGALDTVTATPWAQVEGCHHEYKTALNCNTVDPNFFMSVCDLAG